MTDNQLSWKFAEEYAIERADIGALRQTSAELGVDPVSPSVGAQLAVIASAVSASNIIEIGTGLGVSGLWLLSGAPNALLTTIDVELDYHTHARRAFNDAGMAPSRVRLIAGRAVDVLPRMNEGSYDLVFIDADPGSVIEYVEHSLRLARRGGTVLIAHALWRGRVADPAQRDDTATAFRTLLAEVAASDAVISAISPVGDGLLMLTKIGE